MRTRAHILSLGKIRKISTSFVVFFAKLNFWRENE